MIQPLNKQTRFSESKNRTSLHLAKVQIEKKGTLAEGTSKLLLLGFWVGSGIFNFSGGPIQIPKNGSSSLAISIRLCFLVGATTEDFFLTGSVLLELPMKLLIIFHGVFCFLSCK